MPTLNFKGKSFVQNHHLAVKYHQLIPKKEYSLTDKLSLHDNLILYGDNLAALKALLPTYAGRINCIYIDPPYNTGNENWAYNDNVNSPMIKEWLGKVVDRDDLCRHDKWLCMITPRLKLLSELLAEDGVIFVSIDDNEVHHLRMLMDEIFGDENFITTLIWQKRKGGGNDSCYIAVDHEYILIYSKNINLQNENWRIPYEDDYLKRYKEEDESGKYYWDTLSRPGLRNPIVYDVKCPDGSIIKNGEWQLSKKEFDNRFEKGEIKITKNKEYNWTVHHKVRLPTIGKVFRSIINKFTNTDAANEMLTLLNNKKAFSNPKPIELIQSFLRLSSEKNSIILDSFAGSGTTAHAVLDLNKEDGGNRKFILVEMEDYANKITAERVRRVIKGVKNAKDENLKKGLGGTFSYFELGEPIEMESILKGENLPSYEELARYVFYTATGEEFDSTKIDESKNYIGSSNNYEVYLFYRPDIEYLKNTALNLERAKALGNPKTKKFLVFAPAKYLDQHTLNEMKIEFNQLPFEIYRIKG